jgi:molecular chaperone DnaK (HSP70)
MTVIAIDFGTSNTIVAMIDPVTQLPRSMKFDRLSRVLQTADLLTADLLTADLLTADLLTADLLTAVPTLVSVQPDRIVIGETVRQQRLGFAQPDRYFSGFKRDLVADYQAPDRVIDGKSYAAETIAEAFLTQLWQQIIQQVQPSQVMITLPVGAFERYLDWFRAVTQQLNFPAITWVDESTAAALGYAVDRPGSLCLVVDCGGGTLDLSLVRTTISPADQTRLKAAVLAKSDAYIGGVDIDTWMVEDYLRRNGIERSTVGAIGWQNLLEIAERLKIKLSQELEAKDSWFDDESFIAYELHYTRSQLEAILETQQFFEQFRQAIEEVLAIAADKGVRKTDIDQVLLVGGSSQIPAIQQLLTLYFGAARVKLDKPLKAVAYGALVLTQISKIEDELRHGYAIRLWDPYSRRYSFYPIFAKGIKYPCVMSPPLILQAAIAGQTEIRLDIGELAEIRQAAVDYDAQGRMTTTHLNREAAFRSLNLQNPQICVAHLSPPGQLGVDRVVVEFEVTADRILVVSVQDLLTNQLIVRSQPVAQLL